MCGIVGYVGTGDAVPVLTEGLARLEYRGYDSAGVAVVTGAGLRVHKQAGRVDDLTATLPKRLRGGTGIGHTRWATHGEPTDANAHPHLDASGHVALVHNGIVENAGALRRALVAAGVELRSDTDSELLAQMVGARRSGADAVPLEEAVRAALAEVEGAYGIAVVDDREPGRLVVARNGSPVVVGIGRRATYVASDVAALVRHTDRVVPLDDHELAVCEPDGYRTAPLDPDPFGASAGYDIGLAGGTGGGFGDAAGSLSAGSLGGGSVGDAGGSVDGGSVGGEGGTGGHPHVMHREIHEQPAAVRRALQGRVDRRFGTAHLGGVELSAREVLGVRRVKVLGCGSAHHAGLAGALMIEGLSRIPADAETASEFRYRNPVIERETLYVAVSQSGETFDTLAAVHEITRKGGRVLGVVNTPGSSIARACGSGVYLHAGLETSVASTKAFTSMAVAFALLALQLGRVRDLGPSDGARLIAGLTALPGQIEEALAAEDQAAAVAALVAPAAGAFYVGRVRGHAVALEGALKLKEVSYVHAEALPAAELKHGPLALVGPDTPTVAVLPDDDLLERNLSTVHEIRARRGPVVAVTDVPAGRLDADLFAAVLRVPRTEPELAPILLGVPLQLVAYHAAVRLGRDIDRPRNLAKSVTVE